MEPKDASRHKRVVLLMFRLSLQTCGSNLFWVICLGLIMTFIFFSFGALLGFGYEYLESYTDNYPRSFGAFSFQTPRSLWEGTVTLSWISATNKPANRYHFICAAGRISPPFTLDPHTRTHKNHVSMCVDVCVWLVSKCSLLMCTVITAQLYKQLNPACYVPGAPHSAPFKDLEA